MNFSGGFDLNEMMKQAQDMQERLQREMKDIRVDASAGGGMVTVTMLGSKELVDVKLDPSVLKDGDAEMLQDMIVAAVNEAGRKVERKPSIIT